MKKLLILAYDFPPYVSVGGLRPYSWYKYLKKYGVYPIVVTRQWENKYGNHLDYIAPSKTSKIETEETEYGTVIRSPYKLNLANRIMLKYGENKFKIIRKIISAYYEIMQWFFPVGTKYELYKAANQFLKQNKVDAIIATGEPFVLFRYASLLSKKYKIPWIADYRDPWTTSALRSHNLIFRIINRYNEKKYSNNSNLITTPSAFFITLIKKIVPNHNYQILLNGFDDDILKINSTIKQNDKILSIAFVGTIYKWHPIESFLKVCNDFSKTKKIQINFYGINIENEIQELINNKYTNLKTTVKIYKKINNKDLINELLKNNLLLLFNYYSFSGTKIYDYLAVKRKILFCYTNDKEALRLKEKYYNLDDGNSPNKQVQLDILEQTSSGIPVKNEQELYNVLNSLYKEHKEKGEIECNSKNIEQYSRKQQVEKLADIILKNIK